MFFPETAFSYYILRFIANILRKYAIVFFLDPILDPLLGKDEVTGSNPVSSSNIVVKLQNVKAQILTICAFLFFKPSNVPLMVKRVS